MHIRIIFSLVAVIPYWATASTITHTVDTSFQPVPANLTIFSSPQTLQIAQEGTFSVPTVDPNLFSIERVSHELRVVAGGALWDSQPSNGFPQRYGLNVFITFFNDPSPPFNGFGLSSESAGGGGSGFAAIFDYDSPLPFANAPELFLHGADNDRQEDNFYDLWSGILITASDLDSRSSKLVFYNDYVLTTTFELSPVDPNNPQLDLLPASSSSASLAAFDVINPDDFAAFPSNQLPEDVVTAVIPEPSGMALLSLAGILVMIRTNMRCRES